MIIRSDSSSDNMSLSRGNSDIANRVRAIIIGCGYIARAEHIPNWCRSNSGRIAAVVDTRKNLAQEVGEKLDVPYFFDVETALSACECDSVHICTPADSHVPLIELAVEHGKQVLVEKPLALDSQAATRAVEAAEKAGVTLMVGYPRIFDTDFSFVGEQIEQGLLGQVVGVQSIWKLSLPPVYPELAAWQRLPLDQFEPGTAKALQTRFMEESIHHLNLFRHWFGSSVKVEAVLNANRLWHVSLTFGEAIPVWHTNASPYGHGEELWVYGEEGTVYTRPWSPHFPWTFGHTEISLHRDGAATRPALARCNPYLEIIEEFISTVQENRAPVLNPMDAVEDIRLIEKITEHFASLQH